MTDGLLLLVNTSSISDLPAALHVVSHEILPPAWKSASKALGMAVIPPRGTPTKDGARKIYLQRYASHPWSPWRSLSPQSCSILVCRKVAWSKRSVQPKNCPFCPITRCQLKTWTNFWPLCLPRNATLPCTYPLTSFLNLSHASFELSVIHKLIKKDVLRHQ